MQLARQQKEKKSFVSSAKYTIYINSFGWGQAAQSRAAISPSASGWMEAIMDPSIKSPLRLTKICPRKITTRLTLPPRHSHTPLHTRCTSCFMYTPWNRVNILCKDTSGFFIVHSRLWHKKQESKFLFKNSLWKLSWWYIIYP